MLSREEKLHRLDEVMRRIISEWHDRVKADYVTEDDREVLGLEPEIKRFHSTGNHLIKIARERLLHVTYGLKIVTKGDLLCVESSVNNKSAKFDYESFANRLKLHYWKNCYEKPWTDKQLGRYTYSDLFHFDPRMGHSVSLDIRADKADVIRLLFELNPRLEDELLARTDLLEDVIDNYCLAPLKRIYAETFRG
jgi:hypothetical protein